MPENESITRAMRRDTFVSVVAVASDGLEDLPATLAALQKDLSDDYTDYEIVLVDLGISAEGLESVREALHVIPCVRVLKLSTGTTFDAGVLAGIDSAIGDYVCVIDLEHDPIDLISQIVSRAQVGVDVVQGVSSVPFGGSPISRWGRSAFYAYNRRYVGVDIPTRATYFTVLTRRAVNALTSTRRSQKYFRHLVRHLGLRIVNFDYEPQRSARKSRGLRTSVVEAIEIVSSNSSHPLRLLSYVGIGASLLNLLYAVYVVVIRFALGSVQEGWTSTSLQMSGMFFLLFLILAVMSEYMGRILNESQRDNAYLVLEEFESDVLLADVERRNVNRG